MKQNSSQNFILFTSLFVSVLVIGCTNSGNNVSVNSITDDRKFNVDSVNLIDLIENIENMTKVNDTPYLIKPIVISLCRMASEIDFSKKINAPHEHMAINVYVNSIGKNVMTKAEKPIYPIGTVIIKEKFPFQYTLEDELYNREPKISKNVELYTIMIKREQDYNPECGDWEFASVSGDLTKVEQGKLGSCMECHKKKYISEMDHVFRNDYLGKKYMEEINKKN